MPASLGGTTRVKFDRLPEANKLSIAFVVAAAQTVSEGDPVILNTNGTIQRAGTAEPRFRVIGVALKNAVAGALVTVAMRAWTVINGEAAAATQNAGAVQLGAHNGATGLREFLLVTGADDQIRDTLCIGYNLAPAVADGDPVKVALL